MKDRELMKGGEIMEALVVGGVSGAMPFIVFCIVAVSSVYVISWMVPKPKRKRRGRH